MSACKLTALLAALTAFSACAGDSSTGGAWPGSVHDSAEITIVENEDATSVAWRFAPEPTLVIGGVDGGPEAEFHLIAGAVLLGSGQVVVADGSSGELRFFGPAGDFLHSTGGQGGGPNEFGHLTLLSRIRGDTIVAYDKRRRAVSVFNEEGELARSVSLRESPVSSPEFVGMLDDGSVALVEYGGIHAREFEEGGAGDVYRDTASVYRVLPSSEQVDTIARNACGRASPVRVNLGLGMSQLFPFPLHHSPTPLVFVAGNLIVIGDCDTYALRMFYGSDRRPDRIVRKRFTPSAVAQSDVANLMRVYRDYVGENSNPYAAATIEALENARAVEHFPPYAGLPTRAFVDSDGSFWIPAYTPIISAFVFGEDPYVVNSAWDVFDRQGRLVGSVQAPRDFRLSDLREGRAVGVQRTADDVEQVVVYEITRGEGPRQES